MLENINYYLGSLLYIDVKSIPDISYTVNQASRNCENPKTVDHKALLMILQYFKSTILKSIYYNGKKKRKLVGFSDADYTNDEITWRSVSEYIYIFLPGNSPIS